MGREYTPETKQSILSAIAEATEPVPAAKLAKLPGLPQKIAGAHLPELLAEDVAAGRVQQWGTKTKPIYWHRDAKSVARDRLLELASRENLKKDALNKRASAQVPKIGLQTVRSACAELIKEKYLIEAWKPYAASAAPQEAPQAIAQEGAREVAEKMFAAMKRMAFAPGTTVTFYRLRQQPELADVPKKIFDDAALLLQHDHRALLTVHGDAVTLPPGERDELVTDGLGTYYASIYER